jgi:hypothetical protein
LISKEFHSGQFCCKRSAPVIQHIFVTVISLYMPVIGRPPHPFWLRRQSVLPLCIPDRRQYLSFVEIAFSIAGMGWTCSRIDSGSVCMRLHTKSMNADGLGDFAREDVAAVAIAPSVSKTNFKLPISDQRYPGDRPSSFERILHAPLFHAQRSIEAFSQKYSD